MNCREVRGALSALIDNELSPVEAARVRAHIAECPACRRVYTAYARNDRALRQFARSAPYLPVAGQVRDRLRSSQARRGAWSALARGGQRLATGAALIALVALLIVTGLTLRGMSIDNSQQVVATNPTATAPTPEPEPTPAAPDEQAPAVATATETPAPVVSTEPTPTPVETPAPSITPTPAPVEPLPTATPAPAQLLPRDLYFLAQLNGRLAIWVQPADGSRPRVVASDLNHDIAWFRLLPNSGQIAYALRQSADENPPVLLVEPSGRGLGMAQTPDGQPVAEYLTPPVGNQAAYVSIDRTTLWVSGNDGSVRALYTVATPRAEGIHRIEWSPDGSRILFEVSRITQGSFPRVVDAASGELIWQGRRRAHDLAWEPNGRSLLYSTDSGIFRVYLPEGREVDLTPAELRGGPSGVTNPRLVGNLAWLPDGRIAFTVHEDGTVYSNAALWLMHADGSEPWRPQVSLEAVEDVSWIGGGFAVGTIFSQELNVPPALRYYADHNAEPVVIGAGIESAEFRSLQWSVVVRGG